jgi:hypothetical protein
MLDRAAWCCYVPGSPVAVEPGSELARGAAPVVDDSDVDAQATDLVGIGWPPVPGVFDAQDRAALLGGDAFVQFFVPACDVEVGIVQPQGTW